MTAKTFCKVVFNNFTLYKLEFFSFILDYFSMDLSKIISFKNLIVCIIISDTKDQSSINGTNASNKIKTHIIMQGII